ncbi:pentapeptide MXKDX repeat protein [Caballeronia sp. SBC2]|uniref:pentapeptide MXKDX repeat protein n=1 Tax=Caballeronia sp. SBC2 TaxID=2705547 RepID=UPI0013E12C8A|nr:pentapeptide MXKDX repeat protein [Caballeronia sp. SBC2]QIE29744.1 hypothetical protein SBC2_78200 [Caballeronia sp. SBC2]
MKRIAIAAFAAGLLVCGGSAFAQASGAMSNDGMSNDSMSKDSMHKDTMSKDSMSKGSMGKTMKHDNMMKKGTGDSKMGHGASGAMAN